jgi:hypothetical protein
VSAVATTDRGRTIDWTSASADLDAQGWTVLPGLLSGEQCDGVAALYDEREKFRSHVVMAQHGFGQGEYRYFGYPLPPLVEKLRTALYPRLAPIANRWHERLGEERRFPAEHSAFLDRCHGAGDYNCLHQDLYGEHVFPLQVATLLSEPGGDFQGGEFVLTEQRPRMQTRAAVVPLGKGDAVVFAVNSRPVKGVRGDYRVALRHGVSKIHEGRRHTLGIIFHDAA